MNRIEALAQFKETTVKDICNERLLSLEKYFVENKDSLVQGFVESFRQICIKIKDAQSSNKKGRIGYITYSMMRTAIYENKYTYLVEAFDEQWFLDFEPCCSAYDAGWAFGFMDGLRTGLEVKRKQYLGNIVTSDVENIIQAEARKFNEYVVALARYAIPEAVLIKEFQEIEREDELEIRVDEYRDASDIVFKDDIREKDPENIKEWLKEKLEDEYPHEVFRSLDLRDGDYGNNDLRYADFSGSDLSGSKLNGCTLIGTRFTGANLNAVNLSDSVLYGADFKGCNLKNAVFYQVEAAYGVENPSLWERPGFNGISFEGAELEGADFEGADLKGAVFAGANLKSVNFSGASLKDAVFLKKDAEYLDLNKAQQREIKWKPW